MPAPASLDLHHRRVVHLIVHPSLGDVPSDRAPAMAMRWCGGARCEHDLRKRDPMRKRLVQKREGETHLETDDSLSGAVDEGVRVHEFGLGQGFAARASADQLISRVVRSSAYLLSKTGSWGMPSASLEPGPLQDMIERSGGGG